MNYKLELVTLSDIKEFIGLVETYAYPRELRLIDGTGYVGNPRSVMGVLAALEWDQLYLADETGRSYHHFRKFIVD